MPQNVAVFEWTDDALQAAPVRVGALGGARKGANAPRRAPGDRPVATRDRPGLQAAAARVLCVVQEDTQNCNLIKFQPFSSFPSQVKAFVDGEFHSFVGCAMESMAFSQDAAVRRQGVRFESWCACCLEPISYTSTDGGVPENRSHPDMRIHVGLSAVGLGKRRHHVMCDSMNFVIDPDHAERYERQVSRRGCADTRPGRCCSCTASPRTACRTTTGRRYR